MLMLLGFPQPFDFFRFFAGLLVLRSARSDFVKGGAASGMRTQAISLDASRLRCRAGVRA